MNLKFFRKSFSRLSFAIVGAGPGGFYTAKHILKKYPHVKIDFFEKLPHPYGLIRTGVAPDHQEVKNVEKDFINVIEDPRVRFLGNVEVGQNKDIDLNMLKNNYSSIILSYGSPSDKSLGIKNENFCFSARNFINWYNGNVFDYNQELDLGFPNLYNKFNFNEEINDIVIIGNGNVSIDVARILIKDVDSLKKYDMPESVLNVLKNNKIQNIHIVGRRGVLESAFTIKEIRELSRIENVKMFVFKDELEKSYNDDLMARLHTLSVAEERHIKRKCELINTLNLLDSTDYENKIGKKNIFLRFMLAPKEVSLSPNSGINAMIFNKTIFKGENIVEIPETVSITSQVVFKSLGFKSFPIFDQLGFDTKNNIIKNYNGVVLDSSGNICDNIFTVGWVKSGAKGIIDTTLRGSLDTSESIFSAIDKGLLKEKIPDYESIVRHVKKCGKIPFTYQDWEKVDIYEREEGRKLGKIREKIVDFSKMLNIVNKV